MILRYARPLLQENIGQLLAVAFSIEDSLEGNYEHLVYLGDDEQENVALFLDQHGHLVKAGEKSVESWHVLLPLHAVWCEYDTNVCTTPELPSQVCRQLPPYRQRSEHTCSNPSNPFEGLT